MMEKQWCCDDMKDCVEAHLDCDHHHVDPFDCDLTLIHRNELDMFGLIYHSDEFDGGTKPIRFCPFCGQDLKKFSCTHDGLGIQ